MARIRLKVPQFFKRLVQEQKRVALRVLEEEFFWYLTGRPDPPVYSFKRRLIKKLGKQHKLRIFVESGTFGGDTVEFVKNHFQKLYSIELNPRLATLAKARFSESGNVKIIQGDSGEILPDILEEIKQPALFWLDGHYSGEGTAKGYFETPIMQELKAILAHPCTQHIIMIDDARCFNGTADYPSLHDLKSYVREFSNYKKFKVFHDIIIIY